MSFVSYAPGPPLTTFVRKIWLAENSISDHFKERILPTGTVELVINLDDEEFRIYGEGPNAAFERFSGVIVSGAYSRFFVIDAAEERSVMGVHFDPAGACPFVGVGADELAGRHIDLEDIWGNSAKELRERLCDSRTPDQRFRIVEEALLAHLFAPLERHPAVSASLHFLSQGGVRSPLVRELARETGLSERRFISVFAAEVGQTPKLFIRVQRFQSAIAFINRATSSPNWAELALNFGYYDQSHLVNEFVEFSGFSPAVYFRQLQKHGLYHRHNHLPLVC